MTFRHSIKGTTQFLLEDHVTYSSCFWHYGSLLCVGGPEGKECPAAPALEEWRVCNDHPCMVFYWEASVWGPCIEDTSMDLNETTFWNDTAPCAVGVQSRKVSCMKMNVGPVINKRYVLSAVYLWVWQCLLFWYSSMQTLYIHVETFNLYHLVKCNSEQHCGLTV